MENKCTNIIEGTRDSVTPLTGDIFFFSERIQGPRGGSASIFVFLLNWKEDML